MSTHTSSSRTSSQTGPSPSEAPAAITISTTLKRTPLRSPRSLHGRAGVRLALLGDESQLGGKARGGADHGLPELAVALGRQACEGPRHRKRGHGVALLREDRRRQRPRVRLVLAVLDGVATGDRPPELPPQRLWTGGGAIGERLEPLLEH